MNADISNSRVLVRTRALAVLLAMLVCIACSPGKTLAAELPTTPANPGFDTASGTLPAGWVLDDAVKDKGIAILVDGYPGAAGKLLALRPNAQNTGAKLLGVGQLLDASALRGQRIEIAVLLGAAEGAQAVVGVHVLGKDGDLGQVQINQSDNAGLLVSQVRSLDIPAAASSIIVYAITTGITGTALFDQVQFTVKATPLAATSPAPAIGTTLTIDASQVIRPIPDTLFGTNVEWIFEGQGLWSTSRKALDPDAVTRARELAPSVVRFPGGVFSDTYHWRDGAGPQATRPTTQHHPGGPQSRHSLGINEIAQFTSLIGSELLLTVNVGTGTAVEAADWVRYMREGGRAKVRWWEVGNELYMKGDLSGAHMSSASYAAKFETFADAMRRADPGIRIGAIGGLNYGRYSFIADNRWTETLLKQTADKIDFLAIHNAYAPVVVGVPDNADPRQVYAAMLAAPLQIEANLRDVSALLKRYEAASRPIAIAVTEWGPFFHILPESPWVDHVKTMGSALFAASTLNVFLRAPRVEIANFFKLTDHGFMGWIGKRQGKWVDTALGSVFSLYRHGFDGELVTASLEGVPTFDSTGMGVVDAVNDAPGLDAVASQNGDALNLIVVNKTAAAIPVRIALKGLVSHNGGIARVVHGASLDANTGTELPNIPGITWAKQRDLERFAKGAPGEIRTDEDKLPAGLAAEGLNYSFLPLSVTRITLIGVKR